MSVLGTFTGSTASFSVSGLDPVLGCTVTGSATGAMQPRPGGGIVETDGNLIVNFELPDPLHRAVIGTGRTTILGVAETFATCSGSNDRGHRRPERGVALAPRPVADRQRRWPAHERDLGADRRRR